MQEQEENKLQNEYIIDWSRIAKVLWDGRWLFLMIIGASLVLGVIASIFVPKTYEATATVFPVSSSSSSTLSEYSGLASLAGISLPSSSGGASPSKTVNALLASRLLIETLVRGLDDLALSRDEKTPREVAEKAMVGKLRAALKTREDTKTGVISVSFQLKDPEEAQVLTNSLLDVLDQLLVDKSFTTNRKKRDLLERQAEAQEKKVSALQKQLAAFQRETALLNPTAQAGRSVEAYTSMIQQKMELELQLATAQASYSTGNPRVTVLETQIANLEKQIVAFKNQVDGDLPSLKAAPENLIRYQNLTRDLEIATKIYAGLLGALEQSKLDSDKEQVYIEVLDRALLPSVGKPSQSLVVMIAGGAGFTLALGVVFLSYWLRTRKEERRGKSLQSLG